VNRDPHRVLFPLGVLFAVAAAIVWPAHAARLSAWPGELHARLMVQGFELAFIAGFLLTFLPRVTRTTELARPWDTRILVACLLAFGAASWLGATAFAQAAFFAGLLTLTASLTVRFRRRQNDPPEEFVFIPLGLLLGLAGGVLQMAATLGLVVEPAPRLGLRLVSLGMVLSLVLGVGAILVPTFIGIKDPLVIPKVAGPHERTGRRVLYAGLAVAMVAAFLLEAAGIARAGASLRATVALVMLLWVWKLWNRPTRAGRLGWVLWSAGWLVGAGLVAACLWPSHAIVFMHLTLLGGYGFLTVGIATRVLVSHGGHGIEAERTILDPPVIVGLGLALLTRIGADHAGPQATTWLAASGSLWCGAWGWWFLRAWPRLRGG
jgi:uncharacterized protein involved in response to NO